MSGAAPSSASSPRAEDFPRLRFMGSKYRLLPWIRGVLEDLDFETALDPFTGSGCVSYLMKVMGKQVTSSDFLHLGSTITRATVENSGARVEGDDLERLLAWNPRHRRFIQKTFSGIFYTDEDLKFLDLVCGNLGRLASPHARALATAALVRSCSKRQPRGVFTVAGDPERYKDGRRDLRLTLREHFIEQVAAYNAVVFDNGYRHRAVKCDAFELPDEGHDLVYLDPPYVPRADDNCYVKRYHFLEGLCCYWDGVEIMPESRVKKIKKPHTPFSYRRHAEDAFRRLFTKFRKSTIVLSYSSNGYPDLDTLVGLMEAEKSRVDVHRREHRYHFGTHAAAARNVVEEYLIVGS